MSRFTAGLLAALAFAGCGGGDATTQQTQQLRGEPNLDARFQGVPQDGPVLGKPDAPFTMIEFADLQCPFCARFDRTVLPTVIERFVRPGRVRIELRVVSFLGRDSSTGAAAAVAASYQDKMWQFADLWYRNQGRENSGYATPEFLGRIARAARLDVARWQRESNSPRLIAELQRHAQAARTAQVTSTPTFRLGRTGAPLVPLVRGPDSSRGFVPRLARTLARLRAEG